MSNAFPILCMICNQTIKGDQAFLQHMQNMHGTNSPDQAMATTKAIEQNIPKDIPAIPLDKDAPPSPEFEEMARMMDSPQPPAPTPPVEKREAPAFPLPPQQEAKKPIILKYRYEGVCPNCNTSVRTIMLRVNNRLFATAYCLTHEEIKQIEVHPIEEPSYYSSAKNEQDVERLIGHIEIHKELDAVGKEMKSNGKRSKSRVGNHAAVQTTVQSAGVQQSDQPSVPSN